VTVDAHPTPAELRDAAVAIAVEAGRFARQGRTEGIAATTTKSTLTDLVTEWDRATEALIVERLAARFPGDGIVGEEGAGRASDTGRWWWIDPIDGTTNFVYDLPGWAVSIAVGDAERALAGVVYVPSVDEVFAAAAGGGATLDGRPIAPSGGDDISTALVATGFAYDRERRRTQGRRLGALLGEVRDVRRFGAAAVDLCHVAAGRVDVYFEEGLGPWDVAAGALIATEAGCLVTDFSGAPWTVGPTGVPQVLASTPLLQPAMVGLLSGTERPAR